MKNLLILFVIILYSCSNIQDKKELEEFRSKGRKPIKTTIQQAINSLTRGGVIVIKESYTEDIILTNDNIELRFDNGELNGSIFSNDFDFSITGVGAIRNFTERTQTVFITDSSNVNISGVLIDNKASYKEAITNFGKLNIDAKITAHGSAILNLAGKANFTGGYYYSYSDYVFWNSGGNVYLNADSAKSSYNSTVAQYGGINDSTFVLGGKYISEHWDAMEQGGGYIGGKNAVFESRHDDAVEGTGFYPYGGELAEFDNCTFNCFAINAKSIDNQGSLHGKIKLLTPCYGNRPLAATLNIINPQLFKIIQ